MGYDRLHEWLGKTGGSTVVTLPDGSVDTYYRVVDSRGNAIGSREGFAEWVTDDATSACQIVEQARTMGGEAVNTARQCAMLADDVTLFGHLDAEVFDDLSVTTRSMGEPAAVTVLVFADDELMLSEESPDIGAWTLADLDACADAESTLRRADAISIQNWVAFPNMDAALRTLADRPLDRTTVVFDPGDITGSDADSLEGLATTLERVAESHDVVVSMNEGEMRHLLGALAVDGGDLLARIERLRTRLGVRGALVHDVERALAATADGQFRVPNFTAERIVRRVGAGDRFNGGLAHVLASEWDWELALALGNTCASRYVETGETGSTATLRSYLVERPTPEG